MKKRISLMLVLFIVALLLSGCMSLFTALTIEEPLSSDSSMLVVEMGSNNDYLINNNYTGWAPIVKDSSGMIVPFTMINAIVDAKTIYVAPNVAPGVYTMTGVRHVYTDYGILRDDDSPTYEPYVDKPYHIQQYFPLTNPVKVTIPPKSMISLGYVNIDFEWNGGGFAEKDDRWKAVESTVKITSNPQNKDVLRAIKGSLNSATWKLWNERNPEIPF